MTKVIVQRKNYNDKSNIYICHWFPHPILICRVKSNVHKNVHKTLIWQRKGFCSWGFYNNFWSPKCFWCFEVMFIRKFIMALLWAILWIKCWQCAGRNQHVIFFFGGLFHGRWWQAYFAKFKSPQNQTIIGNNYWMWRPQHWLQWQQQLKGGNNFDGGNNCDGSNA